MDLERRVRVVLGALLGGGGAAEKRQGEDDDAEGEEGPLVLRLRALLASPRRRPQPVLTAFIWSYWAELDASHSARTLFRSRLETSFFMLLAVCWSDSQSFSLLLSLGVLPSVCLGATRSRPHPECAGCRELLQAYLK